MSVEERVDPHKEAQVIQELVEKWKSASLRHLLECSDVFKREMKKAVNKQDAAVFERILTALQPILENKLLLEAAEVIKKRGNSTLIVMDHDQKKTYNSGVFES
jgi:hypothetical protein